MDNSPDNRSLLIRPLTGIRFFAAMSVVVLHSGSSWASKLSYVPQVLKTFLLNGYVGVTLFFVLSGFILHLTYKGGITSRRQAGRFAIARLARLYPVYLLAMLAMLPFVNLSGLADVPQFLLLQKWPPHGLFAWTNWNGPAWTLSCEFFFYIAFPFLSWIVLRSSPHLLIAIICTGLIFDVTTAGSNQQTVLYDWMRSVPVPLLRLPEFLIGVCGAELYLRGTRLPCPSWLLAVGLIIGLGLSESPRDASFATAMSFLLIMALAGDQSSRFSRLLGSRWLVLLGSASYALYLMQGPLHSAIVALFGKSEVALAIQFPVLIVGSILVFLGYEEPMREWIRSLIRMKPSAIEPVAEYATGTHTRATLPTSETDG